MEEVKKKAVKKTSNTSKVHKVSKAKKKITELSNDELLEQILAKKKRKNSKSSILKKDAIDNKESVTQSTKKLKNNSLSKQDLSSDELYDLIKAKKTSRKKKSVEREQLKISLEDLEKKETIEKTKDNSEEKQTEVKEKGLKKEFTSVTGDASEKTKKSGTKEDLIITREITFTEDKIDLKDKKLLKQLRDAIEEYDALDKTISKEEKDSNKEQVEIVDTKRVDKKKIFNTKTLILIIFLLLLLIGGIILINIFKDKEKTEYKSLDKQEEVVEIDKRPQLYEECLKRPLDDKDKSKELLLAEENLTKFLQNNYKASVMYEDLNLGFSYSYNRDVIYYAASTIKSLDALYIYTKAATGEIDLDDTMVYARKYKWSASKEMSKYKFGAKVSLRNLVKYAVTVSDNTAHQMLVAYIGRSNLKEFGKSLGAKNTLVGADNFGSISVDDAIIYMKAINDFINNNGELGEELKSYFVQAEQNGLALTDLNIEAAHKYGEYSYYYHDIGIVYDENPYVIAILTLEGNRNFMKVIKDINKQVYELHKAYYANRENVCHLEVYGS